MDKENYNFMCEHFALTCTPQMYDMLKKVGFNTVGEFVTHIMSFKKENNNE